jgi:hypothetical protein
MYKPSTYLAPKQHCLQTDRSKISYDTRHLGVPSCASRFISKHLVCSMQTVHLSWIKISTISKQNKPSIHLSPFTLEYQQVHTKWFLRLWFIRCKLCTYLTPKLTMSPNGPKRDSIWHMSSRSSIECIQIDFQCSMQTMHLPCIRISNISKLIKPSFHLSLFTQEYQIVRPKWFLDYGALGANCAPILH